MFARVSSGEHIDQNQMELDIDVQWVHPKRDASVSIAVYDNNMGTVVPALDHAHTYSLVGDLSGQGSGSY